METCKAYDPVFDVECTLKKSEPDHELHVNDDGSGWKVTWKTETVWPAAVTVSPEA